MTSTTKDGEVMREIPSLTTEISLTAASAGNRLFGPSGAMDYRVTLAQSGGARMGVVVNADGGDNAALAAQAKHPGWKVAHVGPASDQTLVTDDLAGE